MFIATTLLLSGAVASSPNAEPTNTDPEAFALSHSDSSLELGLFAREGVSFTTSVVQTRLAIGDTFGVELEVPFVILDDGQGSGGDGTSVVGNVSMVGLIRGAFSDSSRVEGGLGVALPTALVDGSGDQIAQQFGQLMLAFDPPYRFGDDQLAFFIPLRLEKLAIHHTYVRVDGRLTLLIPIDDRSNDDVGGAMSARIAAGYRPGPFDLGVAFGATALYGDSFWGLDDTVEGQMYIEPKVGFLLAAEPGSLRGFRLDTRLRVPIDPPAGGTGLSSDQILGAYALFVELGYRFEAL